MYHISNRRYTGSKFKLLDWIEELILENCEGESFFDVFAGTGVVSERMSAHYKRVIMNDFLYSNEVIYKAFFGNGAFDVQTLEMYKQRFQDIDAGKTEDNYFSVNFGGKYFSENDARLIGEIREEIEREKEKITEREYSILLASLVYSMDKVANTVGHYDAYRKIRRIEDRFVYELISPGETSGKFTIYREDANELVKKVKADVAFIDPPVQQPPVQQVLSCAGKCRPVKKPELEGVALKPKPENMSDYCRNSAPKVFADLIQNINVKYIVVTYSNTYHSKSSFFKE